jgi:hypothetical protein
MRICDNLPILYLDRWRVQRWLNLVKYISDIVIQLKASSKNLLLVIFFYYKAPLRIQQKSTVVSLSPAL